MCWEQDLSLQQDLLDLFAYSCDKCLDFNCRSGAILGSSDRMRTKISLFPHEEGGLCKDMGNKQVKPHTYNVNSGV